jgi:hypothetical protein
MSIDPSALLNLWSLEELPACDEGMEHARAFFTSAGEAVSSIENHDQRLLLREFVVLFCIFARTVPPVPNVTRCQWPIQTLPCPA